MCFSKNVTSIAETRIVAPSMTIHSVVMPRELREEPAAGLSVHCCEGVMFVVTVCQNSDVAIFVLMTSHT
jgi:hypothetical protein